ncbi:MAG TPA: glycine cleavage system protein H [Promineifilum sp.]|nr:glycine cleavage system protein H [Promineifilum sp.]
MSERLQFTVDKFTFTIPTDRLYHPEGLWVMERAGQLVAGVTDFFQQTNGDVVLAEIATAGTAIAAGERLGDIETIKVDIELPSPVSGTVVKVNDQLELAAEIINQAPYGDGWLVVIAPAAWNEERTALMSPEAYAAHSHARALKEIGKQ